MKVHWKIQRRDKQYYNSELEWIDHETIFQNEEWKLKTIFEYWKDVKPSYDWRVVEVVEKERIFL